MFRRLHKANLRVTLICTALYFTGYGLILMVIVGMFQLATIPTLWINRQEMSKRNRTYFFIYLGLTVVVIISPLVITCIGGFVLSFFHIWVTKQLKRQKTNLIQEQLLETILKLN